MNEKEKNVKQLIERFLEGETTNAEEQQLYDYFSGAVPKSLRKYQPMFRWYAEGMPESKAVTRPLWTRWAAAASVAVLIGGGVAYYQHRQHEAEMACYEGSYIVRNGQKITDLKTIMPELQKTVTKAQQTSLRIERLLDGEKGETTDLPTI